MDKYVIGLDYGTDSVRCVVINTTNGEELANSVFHYPRWREGLYCDATKNQFRQHPLDYIEGLEWTIKDALLQLPALAARQIVGISVDTTGSTPVAVNRQGTPLALLDEFADNPNAMFILWKDHTAVAEAEEINLLSRSWKEDYTRFAGGIYSSEWFWAKILHTLREDNHMASRAYSWMEHCDWIPFLLSGGEDVMKMKRSRCAAGHKALWHESFGGLPPNDFFVALDPLLDGLSERMNTGTFTSDQAAGYLSREWAMRLGLSTEVLVGVGAFDAHMGAVGGEIQAYYLSKVMGTSTCDILVAPTHEIGDLLVRGICGQVEGSVIPGMLGLEAGQSAFGDVYDWFRRLLNWPVDRLLNSGEISKDQKDNLISILSKNMIANLSSEAEKIDPEMSGILALDWLNGRRTPDANQNLKGVIAGLNLGSSAPMIFRALVEATCYGSRAIVERFEKEGIQIRGIIALGGVAKKSPLVMQILADVLQRPIQVARSEQTCALGAAMFAATVAGVYSTVTESMQAMGAGFERVYIPNADNVEKYDRLYQSYQQLGNSIENLKI